ncbi:MAG: hypothetical protein ACYTEX_25105 [Planctomycetota bacterium]
MPLLNGQYTPTDAGHKAVRGVYVSARRFGDCPNGWSGAGDCRKWPKIPDLRPVP